MTRRTIVAALLGLLLLSSCAAQVPRDADATPEPSATGDGATFALSATPELSATEDGATPEILVTDDLGRTVAAPRNPERVAALIGSFADVWRLAGGLDSLVATADDAWTSLELPLGENVLNLGGILNPSLETLLSADPDLILASCDTAPDRELLPTFEELQIPALYFHVENLEDYLRMLYVCTQITGETECYERYGEAVRLQAEAALSKRGDAEAPSALLLRTGGTSCRAKGSAGTVLGEMLRDLGCRNIADGNNSILEDLSVEAILAEDPDYIFIVCQGSSQADAEKTLWETLQSNPAWDTLRAVREGKCRVMDRRLYHFKPNANWGTAYEQLADILYGEEN